MPIASELQLGADVEYIQLGGNVDLNRDNLVVICGPRISPLIAEVLKSDPVLQFERDDSGWFLIDKRPATPTTHRATIRRNGRVILRTCRGRSVRTVTAASSCSPASTQSAPTASSTT
jgi:hypothetical protein